MAGRDVGFEREVELAHAAAQTPLAQMLADAAKLLCHAAKIAYLANPDQLPPR
jgi:hypothetical protein